MVKHILLVTVMALMLISVHGQDLRRKANLGISLSKHGNKPGALISGIVSGSAAEKAGLRKGDHVITINDVSITDRYTLLKEIRKIRGGDIVRLSVLRNSPDPLVFQFTSTPAPLETYENLSVEPIVLSNDYGDRLRAFVTKPKQSISKLPAILFVSWLSCSSVENTNLNDSWTKMLRDVAEKAGAIMLRLEKPGVGDSEGPACADCDLYRELNGYQSALRYLKSRADVDTANLIIFGGSLGGTLAPIIGKGHTIKAYLSGVSVYKTWLEHMIELERRRLVLSGKLPSEASDLLQGYIEFHTTYLAETKTPEEVMREKPHLASLWYDEPTHQYGRPARFYHQVQQQNFFKNWSEVKVPVLIVAGEYDWIMTLEDSELLVNVLNARHPDQAARIVGKGMDHHWMKYDSSINAFNEINGSYDVETVTKLIEWIKTVVSKK